MQHNSARDIIKISSNSSSKILQVFLLVIAAAVGVVVAVPVVAPVLGLGLGLDPVHEVDPLERVELAPAPEELETEERQQQKCNLLSTEGGKCFVFFPSHLVVLVRVCEAYDIP